MPFIAIDKSTGKRIDITSYPSPARELRSGDYYCQLCGTKMILKLGVVVRPHFAHVAAQCSGNYEFHPETPDHRDGKVFVATRLRERFSEYTDVTFEYEVPIPEVRRVVDVLAVFPMGWRQAHEVQLAGISVNELEERTNDYLRAGIDVIWWLGKAADTEVNHDWCIRTFGISFTIEFHPGPNIHHPLLTGQSG